ncbi:MAG: malate dehydrogenase [Chloroflexia bacterium]|nr:malate dehydrogenase [Chloroflexia bacterium]
MLSSGRAAAGRAEAGQPAAGPNERGDEVTKARPKVTVIGAGMVGGAVAQFLAMRDYADIVLVDIVEGLPQGKALDLLEAGPVLGFDTGITGTNGYEETAGSEVVVITSGIARKPGMSRDDLLKTNMGIVRSVTQQAVQHSPDAVLVVVSNPLDAMCHVAYEAAGFPRERVIGMAGVLDSARFRAFIALELDVSVEDVSAFVLGGHGDTMVPLSRFSTVSGIPLPELLPADRIKALEERTANGGAEIVGLLKTGSAYTSPGGSVVTMVDAILLDKRRILPCSVLLQGEYGLHDLFVGVPVKLGQGGMRGIVELDLRDDERSGLQRSADAVRDLVGAMARIDAETTASA